MIVLNFKKKNDMTNKELTKALQETLLYYGELDVTMNYYEGSLSDDIEQVIFNDKKIIICN